MEEEKAVSVSGIGEEMDRVLPGDCRENGTGQNQWTPFHAYLREDEQHSPCGLIRPVYSEY